MAWENSLNGRRGKQREEDEKNCGEFHVTITTHRKRPSSTSTSLGSLSTKNRIFGMKYNRIYTMVLREEDFRSIDERRLYVQTAKNRGNEQFRHLTSFCAFH